MTNPIPPCPKCGTVPKVDPCYTPESVVTCCRLHPAYSVDTALWVNLCNETLGRALSERGIHTLAELESRLAPDPRVAVWTELADYVESCIDEDPDELTFVLNPFDSAEARGIETGKKMVLNYLRGLIAAQRGEGV